MARRIDKIEETYLREWTIPREATEYIVVHTRESPYDARAMDRWFRHRGYLQCGFHFCATRGGIFETRSHSTVGAHCPGFDDISVAVAILGWSGKNIDLLDPKTLKNFNSMIDYVSEKYPDADIVPATRLRRNNGGYEPFEEIVDGINARKGRQRLPTSRGM